MTAEPQTRIEWTGNVQVHQPFDRAQPLPPLKDHRTHREWETSKETP